MNPLTWAVTTLIKGYQRWISPAFAPRCRYYPSCSQYALEAYQRHGLVKGFLLSTWRILRCNPWSLGGVDHVPPKGQWRAPEWIPPDDWVGHDIEEHSGRKKRRTGGSSA